MNNYLSNYYNSLNERDRIFVIVGLIVLFFYIYYSLLYSPLSDAIEQKTKQYQEKTQTLAWMKSIQNQAKTTKSKQTLSDNQLLTLLSDQLKENKTLKSSYQLQQTGSGDIQLSFNEVPFNLFISWISTINQTYSINIKQFSVEPTPTPGIVKLMIVISGT